jgi:hypothetical protein
MSKKKIKKLINGKKDIKKKKKMIKKKNERKIFNLK